MMATVYTNLFQDIVAGYEISLDFDHDSKTFIVSFYDKKEELTRTMYAASMIEAAKIYNTLKDAKSYLELKSLTQSWNA
jgi:hypothetical protein